MASASRLQERTVLPLGETAPLWRTASCAPCLPQRPRRLHQGRSSSCTARPPPGQLSEAVGPPFRVILRFLTTVFADLTRYQLLAGLSSHLHRDTSLKTGVTN